MSNVIPWKDVQCVLVLIVKYLQAKLIPYVDSLTSWTCNDLGLFVYKSSSLVLKLAGIILS